MLDMVASYRFGDRIFFARLGWRRLGFGIQNTQNTRIYEYRVGPPGAANATPSISTNRYNTRAALGRVANAHRAGGLEYSR